MARPFDQIKPRIQRLGPTPGEARAELLFIHGACHGAWCWHPLAGEIAEAGYGANLLELPGHGEDVWELPATTSLLDYVSYASRAVDQLGDPILVGHSMGGWICQKLLEWRDLCAVLLAPVPCGGLPLRGLINFIAAYPWDLIRLLAGKPLKVRNRAMVEKLFTGPMPPEFLDLTKEKLCPEPACVALQLASRFWRARPQATKLPRLVVAAENDLFMPQSIIESWRRKACPGGGPKCGLEALAHRLGAEYRCLEGHHHNLWMNDPKGGVRDILLAFLASIQTEP